MTLIIVLAVLAIIILRYPIEVVSVFFSIIPTLSPVFEASPWRFVQDQEELSLQRQSKLHSSARTLNYPNPYMSLYRLIHFLYSPLYNPIFFSIPSVPLSGPFNSPPHSVNV